jgi:hypothetical protein
LSDDFIVINDEMERPDRGFISNKDCGEESKIAERQRERESVCERQRGGEKEIALVIK